MIDLGLRFAGIITASSLLGLTAGAVVYLSSGDLGSATIALGASISSSALFAFWGSRALRLRIISPMRAALAALDERQRDLLTPALEEDAAPILRTLFMRLAESRASSVERQRLSEAKIVSVEAAFERIHAVLQSLTEGIIVVDEQGKIVLCNQSARVVLEESKKGLEGRPLVDALTAELRDAARTGLERVTGKDEQIYRRSKLEARGRVYDMSMVPMRMQRMSQDCGRVLLIVDVTKSFEISRLKDELLSSISHELRTPLTNICSSVEILNQTEFENRDEWREFCGVAQNEAMHLNGLVDAVIYYSQIETGEIQWSSEDFDMGELIGTARMTLASRAAVEGLTLEIIGTPTDITTKADQARCQDMILRLLDNAIKFTPEDGRIQLRAENRGDVIRVSISDSGGGIPKNHREKIFERFAQLGDMMTEKPVGTGLGLAICRRVVESMGGRIWCEESLFGGACFVFELPAARVHVEQPEAV